MVSIYRVLSVTALLSLGAGGHASAAPIVFDYTGGFQTFTTSAAGLYQIVAYGAQGGNVRAVSGFYTGGLGAQIGGAFNFAAGVTLNIAVGGQDQSNYGGGGGGSFVVLADGSPLLIAGGGGGAGVVANGYGGRIETSGGGYTTPDTTGYPGGGYRSETVAGGQNGGGGGTSSVLLEGGGGGGFRGDGQGRTDLGGKAYPALTGGLGNSAFGGGGGGEGGGGGGGGYSGGAGGYTAYETLDQLAVLRPFNGGQGGGSFLDGRALSDGYLVKLAGSHAGIGQVTITLVSTVPLPASLSLFGAALLGLAAATLLRKTDGSRGRVGF